MSIEEIKKRLDFVESEIQTVVNKQEYIADVSYLLEQNQRLVEALELIAEREYYDEKYPMKVAKEALQAYKLLEDKK